MMTISELEVGGTVEHSTKISLGASPSREPLIAARVTTSANGAVLPVYDFNGPAVAPVIHCEQFCDSIYLDRRYKPPRGRMRSQTLLSVRASHRPSGSVRALKRPERHNYAMGRLLGWLLGLSSKYLFLLDLHIAAK